MLRRKSFNIIAGGMIIATLFRATIAFAAESTRIDNTGEGKTIMNIIQGPNGQFIKYFATKQLDVSKASTSELEANASSIILESTPTVLDIENVMNIIKGNYVIGKQIKLYDSDSKYVCTIGTPIYLQNGVEYYSGIPTNIDGDILLFDETGNTFSGHAINDPFIYDDNDNIIGFIRNDYSPKVTAEINKALSSSDITTMRKLISNNMKYPQVKIFNELAQK